MDKYIWEQKYNVLSPINADGRRISIEKGEIVESWASFEDPQHVFWFNGRLCQCRQDKEIRIASFENNKSAMFFLTVLGAILDAPDDDTLCKKISPIFMEYLSQKRAEMEKLLLQEQEEIRREQERRLLEEARKKEEDLLRGVTKVYVLQLNNGTIKIGISRNIRKRIQTIQGNSGLKITQYAYTKDPLTSYEARRIEAICHNHFCQKRTIGEFFNAAFDEACAYLRTEVKSPLAFFGIESDEKNGYD